MAIASASDDRLRRLLVLRRPDRFAEVGNCPGCGAVFPSCSGALAVWEHVNSWEGSHVRVRQNVLDIIGQESTLEDALQTALFTALGFRVLVSPFEKEQPPRPSTKDSSPKLHGSPAKPCSRQRSRGRGRSSSSSRSRRTRGRVRRSPRARQSSTSKSHTRRRSRSSGRSARRRRCGRRHHDRRNRSRSRGSSSQGRHGRMHRRERHSAR
mmetsp:Transcript_31187/g.64295  ORF Transcript_31187/g.64295 Transcript_31187/m.64295 type:complete len:210 (-) Transcript_31187:36-665(-)